MIDHIVNKDCVFKVRIPFPNEVMYPQQVIKNLHFYSDVYEWANIQTDWQIGRFTIKQEQDYIDISFKDEQDAVLCILKWT